MGGQGYKPGVGVHKILSKETTLVKIDKQRKLQFFRQVMHSFKYVVLQVDTARPDSWQKKCEAKKNFLVEEPGRVVWAHYSVATTSSGQQRGGYFILMNDESIPF